MIFHYFLFYSLRTSVVLLCLLLNFDLFDGHIWIHGSCFLQISNECGRIGSELKLNLDKSLYLFTWMASANALSWSIGSPSDWIVIFCSTRVSTMPSRSVLYCKWEIWKRIPFNSMSQRKLKANQSIQVCGFAHCNCFDGTCLAANCLWWYNFTFGRVSWTIFTQNNVMLFACWWRSSANYRWYRWCDGSIWIASILRKGATMTNWVNRGFQFVWTGCGWQGKC